MALLTNFAISTVATAPSPATSGTSLVVAAGDGALFPDEFPFWAWVFPANAQPLATNAEIIRVDGRTTDTLTIVRAQEGTVARTIAVGDQIVHGETAGSIHRERWHGQIQAAWGRGDPQDLFTRMVLGGNIAPTPTAITTSVARIAYFRPPADIVVNKIRFFGVGATTNVYRVAIYNADTLARLMPETAFTTAAGAWGAAGAGLGVALTAGKLYFIAVSVNTTGTVAGVAAFTSTQAAATGTVAVLPKSFPGNLDIDLDFIDGAFAQFAVTAGALPATAPAIAAQSAWTGGFPAFYLDSNNV